MDNNFSKDFVAELDNNIKDKPRCTKSVSRNNNAVLDDDFSFGFIDTDIKDEARCSKSSRLNLSKPSITITSPLTDNTTDHISIKPVELTKMEQSGYNSKCGGDLINFETTADEFESFVRIGNVPEFPEVNDDRINDSTNENEIEIVMVELYKELEEVSQYSYAGLVSRSLFILFQYEECHRTYQDEIVKKLVYNLNLSEQLQAMMLLSTGEVEMHSSAPFIAALRKDCAVQKYGDHSIALDLVQLAVRDGIYDSRTRTLTRFICEEMSISKRIFERVEGVVLQNFIEEQHEATEEEKAERKQRATRRKIKQAAIIGAAAVSGGVLIGLTGGLAAPFIAAGVGAAIGTGGLVLGSTAGMAILGSLFGVAGAGLTGYRMNKRVGELKEFEFETLTVGNSLHVTIGISGWLTDKHNDCKEAWLGLNNSSEQYALKFETKYLKLFGEALEFVIIAAISTSVREGLKFTVLAGIVTAITWPLALVSVASIIDNPWGVCTQRSVNAGRHLADVLLSRQQGKRPVTLIGFSFGARVIFACLQEMTKRKNSEGIIEEAVMLGAPVSGSASEWSNFSRVVSGRIINGYCRSDWLLKFMYRTASVQFSIAGLNGVMWQHRQMQNIDLSDIVTGHMDYFDKMDLILERLNITTKSRDIKDLSNDPVYVMIKGTETSYNRMSQSIPPCRLAPSPLTGSHSQTNLSSLWVPSQITRSSSDSEINVRSSTDGASSTGSSGWVSNNNNNDLVGLFDNDNEIDNSSQFSSDNNNSAKINKHCTTRNDNESNRRDNNKASCNGELGRSAKQDLMTSQQLHNDVRACESDSDDSCCEATETTTLLPSTATVAAAASATAERSSAKQNPTSVIV